MDQMHLGRWCRPKHGLLIRPTNEPSCTAAHPFWGIQAREDEAEAAAWLREASLSFCRHIPRILTITCNVCSASLGCQEYYYCTVLLVSQVILVIPSNISIYHPLYSYDTALGQKGWSSCITLFLTQARGLATQETPVQVKWASWASTSTFGISSPFMDHIILIQATSWSTLCLCLSFFGAW